MYKVKFYNEDFITDHIEEYVSYREARIRAKEWCLSSPERRIGIWKWNQNDEKWELMGYERRN